jgi:ribosomal-protein-alanine N-acetyltransferase
MTPKRCAEIHAACFTTPRPWSEAEFVDLLNSAPVFLCSRPEGFALGRIAGPEAELLTIAVTPEARGQGIGAGLLIEFETYAAKQGASDFFLEVAADNIAARALYAKAGYQQCGLRKDYYETPRGPRISALVLRRVGP